MWWGQAGIGWLPTAAVLAMTALAVGEAVLLPRPRPRLIRVGAIALCGAVALGATLWQRRSVEFVLGSNTAQIQDFWSRLETLGKLAGVGPDATSDEIFDAASGTIRTLNNKVAALQVELDTLKKRYNTRAIEPEIAVQMADYLRRYGNHRVVVSCVPADVEAYTYANQIANILRAAGWDALGPETTAILGAGAGIGVNLYVHGAHSSDTARVLIAAFARFNIPYQNQVALNAAIPDPDTVELFIGARR